MPETELVVYIAQFVMTGAKVELPEGEIPGSLPVYLRANFTYPNGMRPIVYARMKLNETERLSAEERESNVNAICRKWWTAVVVNRNFDHEARYENISASVRQELLNNKCADYKVVTDGQAADLRAQENKVDVEDPDVPSAPGSDTAGKDGKAGGKGGGKDGKAGGKSGGSGSGSGANGSGSKGGSGKDPFGLASNGLSGLNKYMQKASGVFCFTQLHVILNRRFHDKIGDYSYSGCLDPTLPVSNSTKPVVEQPGISLAQTDMRRLALQATAGQFMNDQHSLSPLL